MLDVFYDHCLATHWPAEGVLPLPAFARAFYGSLRERLPQLPPRLRRIAPHMIEHDWLASYAERATVDLAVRRIAGRLSRRGEDLVACLPVLHEHEAAIGAGFVDFFPQLEAFAEAAREDVIRQLEASAA